MEHDGRFADYLDRVGEHIRWREARGPVLKELEGHLIDQADRLEAGGMTPEQAGEQAVLQMGDASEVGDRLDRVHRPRRDWVLLAALALLSGIGLFMAFYFQQGLISEDGVGYLPRYLIAGGLGAAALVCLLRLPYHRLRPLAPWLYLAGLLLPAAALLFGRTVNGVARLALFGVTLDAGLPACLLALAGYAGLLQNARGRGFGGLLRMAGLALPPLLVLLLLPRMGLFLLLGLTLFVLLLDAVLRGHFGGGRRGQLALLLGGGMGVPALTALSVLPALLRRLEPILNPAVDPEGRGYLANMAQRILSAARPVGLSESEGMYGATLAVRLPGAADDMALTFLIGQQGWLWGALALLAAGLLLWRLLRTARRSGGYGRALSLSAGLFLSLRLLAGAMANLGLPVLGGIGFPFLSMGGVALLCDLVLCGLVLSVRRRERLPSPVEPPRDKAGPGGGGWLRYEDGRLILTLRPPRG